MESSGGPTPRVLVVDDEVEICEIIDLQLVRSGYEVKSLHDGSELLQTLHSWHPDVLVMDMHLPGRSGLELLQELRSDPNLAEMPVMMISGSVGEAAKLAALERGAIDFIDKPFDTAQLRARVRNLVNLSRQQAELKSLNEQLEQLVVTDPLTGLANRRLFERRWSDEVVRLQRHESVLSVASIDIDNFKEVNDRWGHPAGDDVLRLVAGTMLAELREIDLLARVGGEEFAAIFPHTPGNSALDLAERLVGAVRARVHHPDGSRCTVSIGVASSEAEGTHKLLERADAALYLAKAAGRDRAYYHDGVGD